MKRLTALLLILMTLLSSASASVKLIAVNVGKGDALILELDGYAALIDTGKKKAWDDLKAALDAEGIDALDAVFITHTDKDHVGSLKKLTQSVPVGALYASKYHPEVKREKHPCVKQGKALGLECTFLGAGDVVPLGETGAVLRVLAPAIEFPGNEDDNSLVMMLDSADGRILLTGDMDAAEEITLLSSGADLRCDVLKVPHHGKADACSAALIRACGAKTAVISTNSAEKEDTPAPRVLADLEKAGCAVYVTQDGPGGVIVTLDKGEVEAGYR